MADPPDPAQFGEVIGRSVRGSTKSWSWEPGGDRLLGLRSDAVPVGYPPMTTSEAEVALPRHPPERSESIRQRLLKGGFSEESPGTDRPPTPRYRIADRAFSFHADFHTSPVGSAYDGQGRSKATVAVSEVASQPPRYLELLLARPWTIKCRVEQDSYMAREPDRPSYIARRLLIIRRRQPDDRVADIANIHDTLRLLGARIPELRAEWIEGVAPSLGKRRMRAALAAPPDVFGSITDDIRRAAGIVASNWLHPEPIRTTRRDRLSRLLA